MKFTKVTFTHPLSIKFMSDDNGAGARQVHSAFAHDVGSVSTLENQTSPAVDSIEAVEQWVVIRWNGQTKCVPAAKVESADMAEELDPVTEALKNMSEEERAAIAASMFPTGEAPKRGPGRPRKDAA